MKRGRKIVTSQAGKPRPTSKAAKPKQRSNRKKHVNELLDEALEETFPASDAVAMLEPAPDSHSADRDNGEPRQSQDRSADEDVQ
jgi:hypothetical protein